MKKVQLGQTYGKLIPHTSLGKGEHGGTKYLCACLVCGRDDVVTGGSAILRNKYGCRECAPQQRSLEAFERARKHIGEKHNSLTIIDIEKKVDRSGRIKAVCRCDCGNISHPLLSPVLRGTIKKCTCQRQRFLKAGTDAVNLSTEDGTSIYQIDGRRAINRNNKTGVTGVSIFKDRYRATINFKGKSYELGFFDTIEEAAEARRAAEKELHGPYLEKYKKEHPEKWEKLQKSRKNK